LVYGPLLLARGVPFWLALFIGNAVSVLLLNGLVPWFSQRFDWWLAPKSGAGMRTNLLGVGAVVGVYLVSLIIFALYSKLFPAP
jgi:hypothetical protein